jgi:hypothetical protein
MSFPRNREAASVKETAADFYSRTRELLIEARRDRDEAKLRRGAIRIDGERFNHLSDDRQEDLLELYAAAMNACGVLAP